MEWLDYKTYKQSTASQGSDKWHLLRKCALTASRANYWSGRSRFSNLEEEAFQICGLKKKEFPSEQMYAMKCGLEGEPYVREWYERAIGKSVTEVGISVWNNNPIFRGSMDGDVDDDLFLEIKIPQKMYRPLLEHALCVKNGFTPEKNYHSHIWDSHYDQMIMNGVIHNKKFCDYVVCSNEKTEIYTEKVWIDYDHWEQNIYQQGLRFYSGFIKPLMKEYALNRIDPKK